MGLDIRPGEPSDLRGIVDIYNHYIEHSAATFEVAPLRPDDRAGWLRDHTGPGRHRLVVACEDGRVVGWATTSRFRDRAAYATTVESSVYCAASRTGEGIGGRLYGALFELVATEDIERIVAGMTVPNPASLQLHARFGFSPVGTFHRVGRKFGRFWDVTWFERPLRESRPVENAPAPQIWPGPREPEPGDVR